MKETLARAQAMSLPTALRQQPQQTTESPPMNSLTMPSSSSVEISALSLREADSVPEATEHESPAEPETATEREMKTASMEAPTDLCGRPRVEGCEEDGEDM